MGNFQKIDERIINTYIDSNDILNIDINNDSSNDSNDCKKYSLRDTFSPRTEEASVAKEIAVTLDDCKNFAFYYSVVQQLGSENATEILHETEDDIERGRKKGKPIKNPGALYCWKFKRAINKLFRSWENG